MNVARKDPDMAYWDNLPKIGWHIPDHLKIIGGKVKSPNHGTTDTHQADKDRYAKSARKAPLQEWDDATMMSSKEVAQLWGVMTWKVENMAKHGKLVCQIMNVMKDNRRNNHRVYSREYIMSLEPPSPEK